MIAFQLTDAELYRFVQWRDELEKREPRLPTAAIGGRYTFCFTPTSLGRAVVVRAHMGRNVYEEIDLTDYKEW